MSGGSKLRVLIVGASIAGPTAAYWFAKAGARVTVIERFPQLRTSGQNIDIRTVGVTVMRKMPGMEAAVRAKTVPMSGISFLNTSGRPIATIKPSGNPDQQALISEYEILRGDLAKILYDMTKDDNNITYVFGEQISSIQQHDDSNNNDGPVTVTFANNTLPPSEFDLVVAADGATSRTRALGLGCAVREHMRPQHQWAAYFSLPRDGLLDNDNNELSQLYSAPGGRLTAVAPDGGARPGVARATLMAHHPPPPPKSSFSSSSSSSSDSYPMQAFRKAAQRQDDNGASLKQFIAEQWTNTGWKCDTIIKGMLQSHDFYASEITQVKVPSLHRGRFVLVGDAGYAPGPTGTGTSLALVGAYVLAGEVGVKHRGDLRAGLRGYEEVMKPIVEDLQRIPPGLGTVLAPQTWWGLWLRNVLLWVAWRTRVLGLAQRVVGGLFAGAFAGAEKYTLSEYEWEA
ncbi:oxidoreductase [Chaetomium strumarium]|uniref:Oxidoreductase n=1 Tax=Chaetomium strumarium TaxID=1170767 RepID=A0AAJ0M2K0_9PEZI|nr:oxidoreductase [Chaetomium strumarium]